MTGVRGPNSEGRRPAAWTATGFFWLSAAVVTIAAYWLCLRFFFPGYFHPLSPFHEDFYDYVGLHQTPLLSLLQYPRPAAFASMGLLAFRGLDALMTYGIAIALLSVLLTLALARRVLRLDGRWLIGSFALYSLLLFAHPEFYFEHRHDLPAELSYFYLTVSLVAFVWWVDLRAGDRTGPLVKVARIVLPLTSVLFAVLFAFAKETYFVSALILVAGLMVTDKSNRWRYAAYAACLVSLEICSLLWTRHVNSPFVDPNAAADSTYRISVDPLTILKTFYFYVSHLLNPALLAIVILALVGIARDRRRFVLGLIFPIAALAAFAPHSLLPNHVFEEYAWAAAPLFLVPVLLFSETVGPFQKRSLQLTLAGVLAILAIAGPGAYRRSYHTPAVRWYVMQDQNAAKLVAGLPRFQTLPRSSRVLVVGLEEGMNPWQSENFIRSVFGDRVSWTVALPADVTHRHGSRLVRFTDVANLHPGEFDYVATYQPDEALASIRPAGELKSSPEMEVLVPALSLELSEIQARPHDSGPLLRAAAIAIQWGLWVDAGRFLDQARQNGATDSTYQRLVTEQRDGIAASAKPAVPTGLTIQPAHIIQPDGSGLGVADLVWRAPAGAVVELRVNAPDGPLFGSGGETGHARSAKWVTNGMEFFLQDVTGGKPLTSENTLARVKAEVSRE